MQASLDELIDGQDIVVVEPLEFDGDAFAAFFLAAEDLAHHSNGAIPIGKMDVNGEVLVFLDLVGVDDEKQSAAADIGGRRLNRIAVDLELYLETDFQSFKKALLTLVHEE